MINHINERGLVKVLPVKHPPITTFQGYAVPLSIQVCYPVTFDWMYSNYINIYAFERPKRQKDDIPIIGGFFGDYDYRKLSHYTSGYSLILNSTYPFLQITQISDDLLEKLNVDIISLIKCSLSTERYVYTLVDTTCINAYKSYLGIHDIMVYGYDDNSQELYIADFLSSSGAFSFAKCTYDEFNNAFYSVWPSSLQTRNNIIGLLKYIDRNKDYNCKYQIDFSYIKSCISNYLHPDSNLERNYDGYFSMMYELPVKTYSGKNVYRYFINFIDTEQQFGKMQIDPRLFHGLYDHKNMMLRRIEYFICKGFLVASKCQYLSSYSHVRDLSLMIRNLVLKYNITGKLSLIPKIKDLLEETKAIEFELLTKVFFE